MAKGNLFLGHAKGKVGSIVFSRAFGKQITRTKPTSVRNPKSIGQNTQRAILATIAKEAALLTPIVDHSFATVTYGAESVRHFRKINMGILRNMLLSGVGVNFNLSAKGANAVPNALKISEGNLPSFSSSYQSHVANFYQNGALEDIAEVTVETFKKAYPYLQGGDQLTLVKLVKSAGSLVDGDASFALKVDRMVFASDAFDDPSSQIISDEYFIEETKLDMTKTTNPHMLITINGGGGNGLGCRTDDDNTYAVALILSRKVYNVWQRSTQYLELTEFDDFTDNQTAIDSYGASASLSESTEYLNQADESNPSAGVRGAYINAYTKIGDAPATPNTILAGNTDTMTIEATANTVAEISAIAFDDSGTGHIPFFSLFKDTKQIKVGGGSLKYQLKVTSETAGNYKLEALFANGSKATVNITVSVKA